MSKAKKPFEIIYQVPNERSLEDCFIITPIGTPDSDIFKKTTGLLEAVIEPVLKKLNFKAIPAHKIASPGSIPKQILRHIVEDKLVIANLTGLNPNVMYELAVRHAVKLPLVMLAENGTVLPFDVKDQRTIFYSDTYSGVQACKAELELAINHVLAENYVAENPIYDAIETNQIIKTIAPESKEEYLVNRLDRIETILSSFQKNNNLGYAIPPTSNFTLLKIGISPKTSMDDIVKQVASILSNFGLTINDLLFFEGEHEFAFELPQLNQSQMNYITSKIHALEGIRTVTFPK